MIETIEFNGVKYPKLQSEGNAARWIREFAKYYCVGRGLDIGYCKKEWQLPGSHGIEPTIDSQYHAMNLPTKSREEKWDYIHSSHVLEHVKENWYDVLDYWLDCIRVGGIMFLYLPHKSQEYWLPKNNRKHIHSFDGSEISEYLESLGHDVFCSGVDLNNAFVVVCEKKDMLQSLADGLKEFYSIPKNIPDLTNGGIVAGNAQMTYNANCGCDFCKRNRL